MQVEINIPSPTIRRHQVSGRGLTSVHQALMAYASMHHGEYASYESNVRITPMIDSANTVQQVRIASRPTITMPQWLERDQARPDQQSSWDTMYQALLVHERGHHDIFQEQTEAFAATLTRARPMAESQYDRAFQRYVTALNSAQDGYDDETRRGAEQGAQLHIVEAEPRNPSPGAVFAHWEGYQRDSFYT